MTPEEIQEVEALVNSVIEADVPIACDEMTVEEARKAGPSACLKAATPNA
jgi:alanyl-tRNA synthetase